MLDDEMARRVVLIAERVADGLESPERLEAVQPPRETSTASIACAACFCANQPDPFWAARLASDTGRGARGTEAYYAALTPVPDDWEGEEPVFCSEEETVAMEAALALAEAAEGKAQADLLRDIFGNPFRPAALQPSWQTSEVVGLASTAYEERAFDRLPILADALEDAGCDNADILTHLRGPGRHVRGCWALDLLLGKS
jgi:hypothetical protein